MLSTRCRVLLSKLTVSSSRNRPSLPLLPSPTRGKPSGLSSLEWMKFKLLPPPLMRSSMRFRLLQPLRLILMRFRLLLPTPLMSMRSSLSAPMVVTFPRSRLSLLGLSGPLRCRLLSSPFLTSTSPRVRPLMLGLEMEDPLLPLTTAMLAQLVPGSRARSQEPSASALTSTLAENSPEPARSTSARTDTPPPRTLLPARPLVALLELLLWAQEPTVTLD
mmetsp:Transcript_14282/g.26220  ORF Transcript_14282/g.26220 Transcript_14282/m.26220 type:complete len:219 (-) Transcript_14282:17406-18062(-)